MKLKIVLLSITKISQKLVKQTHGKTQETLEFMLTQQKKLFSPKPPISIEGYRMVGFQV